MKKIFIFDDLKGVCGVVSPSDIKGDGEYYRESCIRMTEEINAACLS